MLLDKERCYEGERITEDSGINDCKENDDCATDGLSRCALLLLFRLPRSTDLFYTFRDQKHSTSLEINNFEISDAEKPP